MENKKILSFACPNCQRVTKYYANQNPIGQSKICKGCQKEFQLCSALLVSPSATPKVENSTIDCSTKQETYITSSDLTPSLSSEPFLEELKMVDSPEEKSYSLSKQEKRERLAEAIKTPFKILKNLEIGRLSYFFTRLIIIGIDNVFGLKLYLAYWFSFFPGLYTAFKELAFQMETFYGGEYSIVVSSQVICSLGLCILTCIVVFARLRDTGSKGWACVLWWVPILDIFIHIRCLMYPQNFKQHKRLDRMSYFMLFMQVFLAYFIMVFITGLIAYLTGSEAFAR